MPGLRQARRRREAEFQLEAATCRGGQINVMDISKVFKEGYSCMDANPNITDDALGTALLDFVKTIEHRR